MVYNVFVTESMSLVSAVIRGERSSIQQLISKFHTSATKCRPESDLPIDPWNDPKVRYGVALALAEISELFQRTIVPNNIVRELVKNEQARKLAFKLSRVPCGLIRKEEIQNILGVSETNNSLQVLLNLNLIDFQTVDARRSRGNTRTYKYGLGSSRIFGQHRPLNINSAKIGGFSFR